MTVKIGFAYGKFPSSLLTKIFTGSYCYHVFFVDEEAGLMYDMNLLLRKRLWPHYESWQYKLVDCPVKITKDDLEYELATDDNTYGLKDYLLFALRPIYHLFGKSTRNKNGVICSEWVYNMLVKHGWPIRFKEVPSPADLEKVLLFNQPVNS